MNSELLPSTILLRTAVVYVRQSTQSQVQTNLESQRRQYDLVETARSYGFRNVSVIDDDLGRSASGHVDRPGFERLVTGLCSGSVGAVFCLEASRLARNGQDWHRVLELCGMVDARVIDPDGIYDPSRPNDRLLLGMKGSISEFELGILRRRMHEARETKARRGELRMPVPVGFIWDRELGIGFDPDLRVQEVVRLIFSRFRDLGSARQVHLNLLAAGVHFPRPSDGVRLVNTEWQPVRYRNVITVLKNPFYAGAYAYGKSAKRVDVVDGRARVSYKHRKPMEDWDVLLKDHHKGYVSWTEYERNQLQMGQNAFSKPGGSKSGRGGKALLAGLICCGRCGGRLKVAYSGRFPYPVYRCDRPDRLPGQARCMSIPASRVDKGLAAEILLAVAPLAVDAAREAEKMARQQAVEQARVAGLELEQARYDARLAERRYAACDPDNRLIAAQLERAWEEALRRVQTCEQRFDDLQCVSAPTEGSPDLTGLAANLEAAWNAPNTSMRARQRLVRTLVEDIVADVDRNEIVLIIRWKGGQHSSVRVRKPATGEHGCKTADEALAVIRTMAGRWPDEQIAASLNRMGMPTGQGKTWNAKRVSSIRRVNDIHGYLSAEKDGDWLTMSEAASELGVSHYAIRNLIKSGILPATQLVARAPWQIRRVDLKSDGVRDAIATRIGPRREASESQMTMFPDA